MTPDTYRVGALGFVNGSRSSDRGAVVLSSLTRGVVAIGLVCAIAFDVISMTSASVHVHDDAVSAAQIGNETFRNSASQSAAISAVESFVRTTPDRLVAISVVEGGQHGIEVTLERTASTLVIGLIPPLRGNAHPRATVTGVDPIT
jgi:hypothetical protein